MVLRVHYRGVLQGAAARSGCVLDVHLQGMGAKLSVRLAPEVESEIDV